MRRAEPAEAMVGGNEVNPFSPSYRDVRGKPYRQVLACQASRGFPCWGTRRGRFNLPTRRGAAWRMTRSGGAASHAWTAARTAAAGTPRYALAPRGHGVRRALLRRVQARRRGAGRMGMAPSLFYLSNHPLLSARRTPYVESTRRRGAAKLGLNAAEAD